jgi:hypothetical protein
MVHLLVLAVVAASDDGFLITTFVIFAFWRKGGCLHGRERSFCIYNYNNNNSHFQGGFTEKQKEFYGKQREFWVSIFLTIFFTDGVLVDFTGRQTKA